MDNFYIKLIPGISILIVIIYLINAYFEELHSLKKEKANDQQELEVIKSEFISPIDSSPDQVLLTLCIDQLMRSSNYARSNLRLLLISNLIAFFIALILIFVAGYDYYFNISFLSGLSAVVSSFFGATFLFLFKKLFEDNKSKEKEFVELRNWLLLFSQTRLIGNSKERNLRLTELVEKITDELILKNNSK